MPVITSETEDQYHEFQVLDRIRRVFEQAAGVRIASGVSSSSFQRLARSLGVGTTGADLVFIRVCTRQDAGFNNRAMNLEMFTDGLLALAADPTCNLGLAGLAGAAEDGEGPATAAILNAIADAVLDDE